MQDSLQETKAEQDTGASGASTALAALVEQAQSGDLEAFNRLVEQFQDTVFGAAYALLAHPDDAQDVAQEAFLHAWRDLRSLREPDKFHAWLYRITQNLARNHLTRQRRPAVPIDQVAWSLEHTEQGRAGAEAALVQEAINTLSEPNRLATVLFYLSGYRIEEIAALLGVPVGTVKRRLHDSRNHLRQQMMGVVQRNLSQHRPSRDDRFAARIAIFTAAWTGETARIAALLTRTPTLAQSRNSEGWTPLHYAAQRGHQQVVELLLAHQADFQAREEAWGWTPLHLAAKHGHKEVAALLEARGATLDIIAAASLGNMDRLTALLRADAHLARDWGAGSGPLHWAAGAGHRQVVEALLTHGAAINARSKNTFSNTALHCGVLHAHTPIVELLLAAGADVSVIDGYGATPLHAVAKYPHGERVRDDAQVVDLLLAHGAELNAVNHAGETPLHWAATRGQKSVAKMLLDRGAQLDIFSAAGLGLHSEMASLLRKDRLLIERRGPGDLSPLHFAAYGDCVTGAEFLIAQGAPLDATGGWFGGAALHLAAYQGRRAMVELLLARGADANARDANGWTPLHQFRFPWWTPHDSDRVGIATALLARGAAVNAQNSQGETPLHCAAHAGAREVVAVLLARGADLNARDNQGRTPLHRAALQLQQSVIDLLSPTTRSIV